MEADAATGHSLKVAASIYEDAAKCFDKQGNRLKAGQYLTIAGDFYLEIGNREKAATCYGKAIVRHLMIDDVDTAKILVNKGEEYGFTSATYQFKMALNALDRKTSSLQEDLQVTEEEDLKSMEEILPDIDIIPLDEEEDLIFFETEKMLDDFPKLKDLSEDRLQKLFDIHHQFTMDHEFLHSYLILSGKAGKILETHGKEKYMERMEAATARLQKKLTAYRVTLYEDEDTKRIWKFWLKRINS